MLKEIMKKLTSPGLQSLLGKAGCRTLGLIVLAVLTVNLGRAQTNFASPLVLTGDYGLTNFDNTGVTADPTGPTIAGLPPTSTLWFQWSTTNSGEVELDTIGSVDDFFGSQLDTVLGVYTGTSLASLNLVSANDNLYPVSQLNEVGQNFYTAGDTNYIGTTNPPQFFPQAFFGIIQQPFSGPSGLRFNAVAGTTYYFAVDTRGIPGSISLNWALHPSGVFRFATENSDLNGLTYPDGLTPMLLYQCSATESGALNWPGGVRNFTPSGALVTITRVAGSSGRVTVDYSTVDLSTNTSLMAAGGTNGSGTNLGPFLINGDLPAVAGTDYSASSGTITFDDFEMSKTIQIPIINGGGGGFGGPVPKPNRDFGIVLSNPQLDPSESTEVAPPRVDSTFGMSVVRILDVNTDPRELNTYQVAVTNIVVGGSNTVSTNLVYTTTPTNAVFNFQRANYLVYRAGSNSVFTLWVHRTGTNTSSATINYAVNCGFPFVGKNSPLSTPNTDNVYPLQPGSDYATPDPINTTPIKDKVPDFIFPGGYSGALSWGDKDFTDKTISFSVYDNGLQQFNEDFQVSLYGLDSNGNPLQVGMVADCTVTILNAHDLDSSSGNLLPPAGAVDELFNPDYASQFWSGFTPTAHPGTDGIVNSMALQPDGNTILAGNFYTYNGDQRNCIARVDTAGNLDNTFDPGLGADDFISSVALTTNNEAVIGGNFTSYNGTFRSSIALVNTNGALDTSFQPGQGFDGTVYSVVMQTNGQILVGGSFSIDVSVARNGCTGAGSAFPGLSEVAFSLAVGEVFASLGLCDAISCAPTRNDATEDLV